MHFNAKDREGGGKEDVWRIHRGCKKGHQFPSEIMVDSAKNEDSEPIIFPFGSLFELCAYVKTDLKFGKGKY